MAGVSNYSQHPCGPQWLMYSRALGGAVRRRTPSLLLCSVAMLDWFRILNTQPQITLSGYVIVFFPHLLKPLSWFSIPASPLSWFYVAQGKVSERHLLLHTPAPTCWRDNHRRFGRFFFFLYTFSTKGSDYRFCCCFLKSEPSNVCVYHLRRPLFCWLPVCCSVWGSGK